MRDIVFVLLAVAFFALAARLVRACESLLGERALAEEARKR